MKALRLKTSRSLKSLRNCSPKMRSITS